MKIAYLLSGYVSHFRAGLAYRELLGTLGHQLVEQPEDAELVVIHNEPWSLAGYYRAIPALRDRRVAAYCVWETDRLPPRYRHNLGLVSEVWTCSEFCRTPLASAGRPVAVVPHVVTAPTCDAAAVARMRERIGPPGPFTFYAIAPVTNPRKGVPDLLAVWDGLFAPDEARLVLKTLRGIGRPLPRGVVEIAGLVDDSEIAALHHAGDCLVSTHRSEGWGLAITEAMSAGRLVVATGYGGNMDYMSRANSLPVAYREAPIRADESALDPEMFAPDMRWGYIDRDDLARQLRRAITERDSLAPLARQAAADMQRFAPAAVAAALARAIEGPTCRAPPAPAAG